MNFAEALRQAAKEAGAVLPEHNGNGHNHDHVEFEPTTIEFNRPQLDVVEGTPKKSGKTKASEPKSSQPKTSQAKAKVVKALPESQVALDAVTAEAVAVPTAPAVPATPGSVVRLELFLTPEQLNGLFRAVVANQHTVMTLREASSYLRVNPSRLEEMAQEGEIPAFLIDGKWRFPRNSVDEWLNMQSFRKEMEA